MKTIVTDGFIAPLLSFFILSTGLSDVLVVGVEDIEYLPHYEVRDGRYVGFAQELLDEYAKESGHVFEYRPLPVKRLYMSLLTGSVDFKYPDNPTWAQKEKKGYKLNYSDAIEYALDGVCVLSDKVGHGKLRTLGVLLGFTPRDYEEKIASGELTVHYNENFLNLIRLTLERRIDGVYGDVDVIRYLYAKYFQGRSDRTDSGSSPAKFQALMFDNSRPHSTHAYKLSTLNHSKVLKDFNSWLQRNSKRISDMRYEHGLSTSTQDKH